MKFVLMAFDEGTGLTRTVPRQRYLERAGGKAIIGYEGRDYELNMARVSALTRTVCTASRRRASSR